MAHQFSFLLTGKNLIEELDRVKNQIISNGGEFSGNEKLGEFSGSGVKGSYSTKGLLVTITILKKPFFATNSLVESKLKSYFGIK